MWQTEKLFKTRNRQGLVSGLVFKFYRPWEEDAKSNRELGKPWTDTSPKKMNPRRWTAQLLCVCVCNCRFYVWGYEELAAFTTLYHFTQGTCASVDLGACRAPGMSPWGYWGQMCFSIINSVNQADSNQSELYPPCSVGGKVKKSDNTKCWQGRVAMRILPRWWEIIWAQWWNGKGTFPNALLSSTSCSFHPLWPPFSSFLLSTHHPHVITYVSPRAVIL